MKRVIGAEPEHLAPVTAVVIGQFRRLRGARAGLSGQDGKDQGERTGSVTHHRWTDLSTRIWFNAVRMAAAATPAMNAIGSTNSTSGWTRARQTSASAVAVTRRDAPRFGRSIGARALTSAMKWA